MAQAVQTPYQGVPADIVNQAIDLLGEPGQIIGDMDDGTKVSEAARRWYTIQLYGLLRGAHWNFARKQATLQLLADATGQTANVSTFVEQPWTYAYAWPTDAAAVRWVPVQTPVNTQGAATTNPIPPMNSGPIPPVPFLPASFLISSSDQYPVLVGQPPAWNQYPDIGAVEGVGLTGRRVILANIPNAGCVYTRVVTTLEEWDPLFREALVESLAAILAPTAIQDRKLAIEERDKHVGLAVIALNNARIANGNDAGYPQTTNHLPAWITSRNGGWGGMTGWDYGMGTASPGVGGLLLPYAGYSLCGNVY